MENKSIWNFTFNERLINNIKHNWVNTNVYKNTLIEEFDNHCGYCGSLLGLTTGAEIDQFYPKSKFPEKAMEIENLILCCHLCNISKGNQFPVDSDGNPILLNPNVDKLSEHIDINKDGVAMPLSDRGKKTIEVFNLNRPALIEDRKVRKIEYDLIESYKKGNAEYYKVFQENIQKIRELTSFSDLAKEEIKHHLLNMLYANAITSLETYLSDAFINTVKSDKKILRRFVETFHDFKQEKFELRELFSYYENIEEKAIKSMLDVIYHDLGKVKGMYKDTLDIEFPDISTLFKAVKMRHDFVHRNGKMKDGKLHQISSANVTELCDEIEKFVNDVNKKILAVQTKKL